MVKTSSILVRADDEKHLFTINNLKLKNVLIKGIKPEYKFLFENVKHIEISFDKPTQNVHSLVNTLRSFEDSNYEYIDLELNTRDNELTTDLYEFNKFKIRKLKAQSVVNYVDSEEVRVMNPSFFQAFNEIEELDFSDIGLHCIRENDKQGRTHYKNPRNTKTKQKGGGEYQESMEIDASLFSKMKNLKVLNLFNNLMHVLEPNAYLDLTNLIELNLASNRIKNVRPGAFNGLQNLLRLNLASNHLDTCRGLFFGLTNLIYLDLSYNKVDRVNSDDFSNLRRLECLKLNGNPLTHVDPDSLNHLQDLKELHLPRCFDSIYQLDLLKNPNRLTNFLVGDEVKVKIETGRIFSIDLKGLEWGNLKHFRLRNIEMHVLEQNTFHKMRHFLTHLTLVGLNLESIEKGTFDSLPRLTHLDLSANNLNQIEDELFFSLTKLENLNLSNNNLNFLSDDALVGLVNLTHLNLSANKLTMVKENRPFLDLLNLEMLDLHLNQITEVKNGVLKGLDFLKHLDLSFNNITEVKENDYEDVKCLHKLSLAGDFLVKINPQAFNELKHLEQLAINITDLNLATLPIDESIMIVKQIYF